MINDRQMPIMQQGGGAKISGCPKEVPFSILDQTQAYKNHWQSLERLADRGGLSVLEAVAIIQGRRWHDMDQQIAIDELNTALRGA